MSMTPPGEPQATSMGRGLVVLTALSTEARAVRAALPAARLVRCGVGPDGASAAGRAAVERGSSPLAVAGFCRAILPELRPGDVVVASEVRGPSGTLLCPSAGLVMAALRRRGIDAALGPIALLDHIADARELRTLRSTGAVAADMESRWLMEPAPNRPVAALRVVFDVAEHDLWDVRTPARGPHAGRALREALPALGDWAAAAGQRSVLLASPRAFCAGVERAVEIVEKALARLGPPVYVRKQIVHNVHVVSDLERRGATFVDEVSQVPEGSLVVFSAHGVAPHVRAEAARRHLRVIDATCPLVSKVHAEARRFSAEGRAILLIGHAGHEETEGTQGEAPGSTRLVQTLEEVAELEVEDPRKVAYLTQTTLSLDETREIVEAARKRFPALVGPPSADICYATQNRQDALKAIAPRCDVVFVVGSGNSSNSRRLVEASERLGTPAHLIDDANHLDPAWLLGASRVGLTAGASAPGSLVWEVVKALRGLGELEVTEHSLAQELAKFSLPKEVR